MAMAVFVSSLFLFFCVSPAQQLPLAPALYAFGDSLVDAGNNNGFKTYAKYDYPPYGIDFVGGFRGRPTNGYNVADFFATWLGLNVPPAFRLVNTSEYDVYQGFNYASSAAGILPDTGKNFNYIMNLSTQIGLFKKTLEEYLPKNFEDEASLSDHLSKSIFVIVMGANDFGQNFLKNSNSTNPVDYASNVDTLLENLGNRLEDLYKLGARKFVVFDIEALGCLPLYIKRLKPVSKCVDYINAIVQSYNENLPFKLKELGSKFTGSTFTLGKFHEFTLSLVQNPQNYGMKESSRPCCEVLSFGICNPKRAPCEDRDSHVYFDAAHPTEAAYKIFAQKCFSGQGSCQPFNVQDLAKI